MQTPESAQNAFANLAGEIAEMFSFNPSIGQLYGFLFVSDEALSLEDIAKACNMSKGNASIHLRTLENWGAVHRSWRPGTRKDYYTANTDLRGVAVRRFEEGIRRRLDRARHKFASIKKSTEVSRALQNGHGQHWTDRLKQVESLFRQVDSGFATISKLLKLKSRLSWKS